jgi:LysM repeat protein
VSQYAIFEANNLNRYSKIYAGKYLIVPVPLGSGQPARTPKERYATGENTYIVQKGDNLWDISRSFNTSPEELRKTNYMGNSSRIYVGQVLKLPGSASAKKQTPRKDYDREPAGTAHTYVVKRGDTVWDIARTYGTTTATIRRMNGLNRSSRIYVGQKLQVPGSAPLPDDYLVYIVRRGDTLSEIARAFRTSVRSIMRLNNISDAKALRVGARLKILKN